MFCNILVSFAERQIIIMNKISSSILSQYRTALFGIGTLGVLAGHSVSYVQWPGVLSRILGLGGIGVYLFVFLSGIGLYYSMTSRKQQEIHRGGYRSFICKRFLRVGIPYLIIAGVYYGIRFFMLEFSPIEFFYNLSTLSFWTEHQGAWYVAMLVPVYVVYPFYYSYIENGNRLLRTILSATLILLISCIMYVFVPDIYRHLAQVINSFLIFTIGNYIGRDVKENKEFPFLLMIISLLFYPIRALLSVLEGNVYIEDLSYAMLGLALCLVCALLMKYMPEMIIKILKKFGIISLEMYLTHIFLLSLLEMVMQKNLYFLSFISSWCMHAIICVGIYCLSYIFSVMVRGLLKKILLKYGSLKIYNE